MKTKTFLWSTSSSFNPVLNIYDNASLSHELSLSSATFDISGGFIYFRFNTIPIDKGDAITSIKFVVKTLNPTGDPYVIQAKTPSGTIPFEYSSNEQGMATFELDVTSVLYNNDCPNVVGIRCPTLSTFFIYGRGTNAFTNNLAPRLVIEYIPASEAIANQKYIDGSLNDELSYSVNIANSLLYLNKGLFPGLLLYNLSFTYNSYHIDKAFLFFPKGWRINILESIAFDNGDIIFTDSSLNERRFKLAENSTDTYYDTSGSGMVIRSFLGVYRLYQNLYDLDTYKTFGSNNYVSSINLPYNKAITINYTSTSVTITDYNNNVVTISDVTENGAHYLTVTFTGTTIYLVYKISFISGTSYLDKIQELLIPSFNVAHEISVVYESDYSVSLVKTISNDALKLIYYDDGQIFRIGKGKLDSSNTLNEVEHYNFHYFPLRTLVTNHQDLNSYYQFDKNLNFIQSYDSNTTSPLLYRDEDEMDDFVFNHDNLMPLLTYQYRDENNFTSDVGTITFSSYSSAIKTLTLVNSSSTPISGGFDYVFYITCTASVSIPLYGDRKNVFTTNGNLVERKVSITLSIYKMESSNKVIINTIEKEFFAFNSSETRIIPFTYPNDADGIDIICTTQGTKGTYVFSNAILFKTKKSHPQVMYEVNLSNLVIDYIYWKGIKSLSYSSDRVYFKDVASNKLAAIFSVPYYFVSKKRKLIKSNNMIFYSGVDENNNNITLPAASLFAKYQYKEKNGDYSHTLSYLSSDNNYAFYVKTIVKYHLNGVTNTENEIVYYNEHGKEIQTTDKNNITKTYTINSSGDLTKETITAPNTSSYFETNYVYSNHRLTSTSYLGSSSVVTESNTYLGTTEQLVSHTDAKGVTYTYGYSRYEDLNNIQVNVTTSSNKAYTKSVYSYDYLTNMNNNLNKFTFGYDKYNLLSTINVSQLSRGEIDDYVDNTTSNSQNAEVIESQDNDVRGPVNPDPPAFANLYERQNYIDNTSSGTFEIFKNHQIIHYDYDKYKHLSLIDFQNDNGASLAKAYFFYADLPINSSINLNNINENNPINDDYVSIKSRLVKIIDNFSSRVTTYTYNDEQQILKELTKEGNDKTLEKNISYDFFNRVNEEEIISDVANYKFASHKVTKTYTYHKSSNTCFKTENVFKISNVNRHFYEEVPLINGYITDSFKRPLRIDAVYYTNASTPTTLQTNITYFSNGNVSSDLVKQLSYYLTFYFGNNPQSVTIANDHFTYDENGNILTYIVKDESNTIISSTQYTYDRLNRLTEEKNVLTNSATRYTYDNYGNILGIYDVTNVGDNEVVSCRNLFGYDSTYKDELTFFDDPNNDFYVTYDNYLNPITIGNDTLTWIRGRLLNSYSNSSYSVVFAYDHNGIRTQKSVTVGNVTTTHKYALDNNRIIGEKITASNLNHYLSYFYGLNGIIGFNYDNDSYLFRKNIFGDITHIYKTDGTLVATYDYDAYGNTTVHNLTSANIGDINPFRYRSYYFDQETGLYYCQSRYYKPNWCRWLNADSLDYLNNTEIGGVNLFAYCHNNPVMYRDESGHFAEWVLVVLFVIFTVVFLVTMKSDTQIIIQDEIPAGAKEYPLQDGKVIYYSIGDNKNSPTTELIIYNSSLFTKGEIKEFLNYLIQIKGYVALNVQKVLNEWAWHKIAYYFGFFRNNTTSASIYLNSDDVKHGFFSWIMNNWIIV